MRHVQCEGWWEQEEFGRQPMQQLQLKFEGHQLAGSGVDIIGPFALHGTLENANLAIVKRYIGQHSVDYIGTYDGEGTMHGMWSIGLIGGEWMIKIVAESGQVRTREIQEWVPRQSS